MISGEPTIKLYERGTPESYRQDARLAMGTRVENAVVELITNADDSYERLEEQGGLSEGKIRVVIRHRRRVPHQVIVGDRAQGLSDKEMERCFTYPGRDTSGRTTGLNVRGSLGRGAKDVPYFGRAKFECVKDDRYAGLEIDDRGEGGFVLNDHGRRSMRVTPEIRERLGIRKGNGTQVTISIKSNFNVRQFQWWCETFRKHFQLRDILSDPRRRIEFEDANSDRRQRLHYKYPQGKLVLDKVLQIPGYPDAQPRLVIYEHGSRDTSDQLEDDKLTAYWEAGILVKGRKAIFESTFFDRSLAHDAEAGRFFGELRCPYIDSLITEFQSYERDRREPPLKNNMSILKRDRTGLHSDHPFVELLYSAAGEVVRAVMAARRATNRESVATEAMEKRLDSVARAAEKFLNEIEEETEDQAGSRGDSGLPPGLYLIPRVCSISPGESATMSVISVGLTPTTPPQARVTISPEEGLKHHPHAVWTVNGDERNKWKLPIRIEASERLGTWSIGVSVGEDNLLGEVRVANRFTPEPPAGFQFEHTNYSLRVGKPRSVWVVAPRLATIHSPVYVSCDNSDVTVKRGGVLELRELDEPPRLEGAIEVVALRAGLRGTLFARSGDALARARVSTERAGGPKIKFDLTEKTKGSNRSWWEALETERGMVRQLWITVRDKSIGRYLGEAVDGKWPGQDSKHFRMLLAEIIAEEVVREHLLKQSIRMSDVAQGVPQVLFEIQSLKQRFLPIAHRLMIPSPEAP